MVKQDVRERQSQVQRTGDAWEDEVIQHILPKIQPYNLEIVKGKKSDIREKFWKQLYVPTKRDGVGGDIDLIVYNKITSVVVAIISCKVSLHGRFTESLFYWLLFREKLKRPFRFVFATNDKGRGQGSWKSEWGSQDTPTKDRELAEAYTDGVYVKNANTHLGGILKPLDLLAEDIIQWSEASL